MMRTLGVAVLLMVCACLGSCISLLPLYERNIWIWPSVEGQVFDEGEPVVDAAVRLVLGDSCVDGHQIHTRTDASGSFRFKGFQKRIIHSVGDPGFSLTICLSRAATEEIVLLQAGGIGFMAAEYWLSCDTRSSRRKIRARATSEFCHVANRSTDWSAPF